MSWLKRRKYINISLKGSRLTDKPLHIKQLFGFNRAIVYGVMTRVWGILAGLVTVLVIASQFSRVQQGYFYTFSSLLALQVFFELGLMGVIATFSSHEFAKLSWGSRGQIHGDPHARQRLTAILCKSVKWFGVAALLLVVSLIPIGMIFFNLNVTTDFVWRLPWVLAVLGTTLNLLATPFLAVIMGSGDVVAVNQRAMVGGMIGSCFSWLVMGMHGGLFAVCAVIFGNAIISWSYLIKQKPEMLKIVWQGILSRGNGEINDSIFSWRDEIWPLQWKIALSWISGYFLFQLFNPVLFHYHGPVVAGQMGMTLSASSALQAISLTLLNAKSPEFGKLIAHKKWQELDSMFYRVLIQSIVVVSVGACVGWTIIWFLQTHYTIGQRFIPARYAALLFAAVVVQLIVYSFATYLRAHKQEPFLFLSIIAALLQGSSIWFFGMRYSSFGVTASYFIVNLLFTLPVSFVIWSKCKINWHS